MLAIQTVGIHTKSFHHVSFCFVCQLIRLTILKVVKLLMAFKTFGFIEGS